MLPSEGWITNSLQPQTKRGPGCHSDAADKHTYQKYRGFPQSLPECHCDAAELMLSNPFPPGRGAIAMLPTGDAGQLLRVRHARRGGIEGLNASAPTLRYQ